MTRFSYCIFLQDSIITPCKIKDTSCIEKSVNAAIPNIISGIPELGVESSDPLFISLIEGNLSILKYKFFNTTITGYKTCRVSNLKLDEELTSLQYDLNCQKFHLKGKYEVDGRLVILPVEGKGDFELITGKYLISADAELKTNTGSDGKTHLSIKSFKLKSTPKAPLRFDFKNLFNGQKDLSDTVHKFANENWLEVAELVQDPTWDACMKKVTKNVNKLLKIIPLEELQQN